MYKGNGKQKEGGSLLRYQFKKNVSQIIQLNALVIGKVKVKQGEKWSKFMGMH